MTDMPRLLLRVSFPQPEADLFRTPILRQFLLNKIAKHRILTDPPAAIASGFLPRAGMREDRVVLPAVVSAHIPAQLTTDRRR
ncbi:hypothetical protein [Subtercola vilae]|uniref:hypothetical protein n=1 Tax=Subtercola vilae TaxID=2056433 RepID=UPI001F3637F6|nr:hypothetical protein [Subtercola vilae]